MACLLKALVGGSNYAAALKDMDFWASLGRTLIYSAIAVILINVIAFLLAYAVTRGMKGQNFFRAGFFVPNLIGGIVLGYIWQFVFNRALPKLFAGFPKLLGDPKGAMAALIIVSVWQYAGYMMLIYVAGFMSVSKSLMEAAQIDGCTQSQSTWYVVVPLMRSSFVQCLFLSITRCFMVYDVNLSFDRRRSVRVLRTGSHARLQSGFHLPELWCRPGTGADFVRHLRNRRCNAGLCW